LPLSSTTEKEMYKTPSQASEMTYMVSGRVFKLLKSPTFCKAS